MDNSFYTFSTRDQSNEIIAEPYGDNFNSYMDIMRGINIPILGKNFMIKSGNVFADVIYGGWPGMYLVSTKFYEIVRNLQGIIFTSVSLYDKQNKRIDKDYFLISISGKSGVIDDSMSQNAYKKIGNNTRYMKMGLYFTHNSWDGSDFFIPEGTSFIFITEKAKLLIEENKISNCLIRKDSDIPNYSLS